MGLRTDRLKAVDIAPLPQSVTLVVVANSFYTANSGQFDDKVYEVV